MEKQHLQDGEVMKSWQGSNALKNQLWGYWQYLYDLRPSWNKWTYCILKGRQTNPECCRLIRDSEKRAKRIHKSDEGLVTDLHLNQWSCVLPNIVNKKNNEMRFKSSLKGPFYCEYYHVDKICIFFYFPKLTKRLHLKTRFSTILFTNQGLILLSSCDLPYNILPQRIT